MNIFIDKIWLQLFSNLVIFTFIGGITNNLNLGLVEKPSFRVYWKIETGFRVINVLLKGVKKRTYTATKMALTH